jgi:hypothetical protein
MEYVNFRGEYDEIPRDDLLQVFAEHYPRMQRLDTASWEQDVAVESKL